MPNTILNHKQIGYKFIRLAWQVYENNMDESSIWLVGIDQRGHFIAQSIAKALAEISQQRIEVVQVDVLNQAEPLYHANADLAEMSNGVVILVDDVLNSGKTIMKAMVPMLSMQVSKIQVAVLASRSHRLYPIKADYVGISMATTLHEHLTFDNTQPDQLLLTLN